MTASTRQPTRKPQPRTMTIEADPFGGGLVRLTVGKAATTYRTTMIPAAAEFGPFAFEFAKLAPDHAPTGEVYHLTCDSPDPAAAAIQCDCKGHAYHGHCKHADCLRKLLADLAG